MLSGCGEADDDVAAKYLFAGGGERVSSIPGIVRGPRGVVVSRHQEIRALSAELPRMLWMGDGESNLERTKVELERSCAPASVGIID